MSAHEEEPVVDRRSMSFSERVRGVDSYGILLVLILVTLFAAAVPFGSLGSVFRAVVTGLALLFAMRTSGASRREMAVALVVVVIVVALSLPFEHDSRTDRILRSGASLVLTLGVLAAIARRVGAHPVVSGATIAAALCVYLVLGLVFAATYGLVGAIADGPAFVGTDALGGDGTTVDQLYFSFTTLSTVGFGDLTPADDVMRMLTVTEAFTGQLYLVTVVALIVGNLGRERRRR
jgi:hypothetical protein